ncbi:hypothetical protein TrRE_jg8580, partial [Triparma retinervis]
LDSLPPLNPPASAVEGSTRTKSSSNRPGSKPAPVDPSLLALSSSLNKDYLSLALEYSHQSQYRVVPTTLSVPGPAKCALCRAGAAESVFFPCGHRCVCEACRAKNCIGMPGARGSWNFCPICCGEIKLALEHDGTEEDRYWRWVKEVRPNLSGQFVKNFTKRSKAKIRRVSKGKADVVPEDDGGEEEGGRSRACAVM